MTVLFLVMVHVVLQAVDFAIFVRFAKCIWSEERNKMDRLGR